jgi:hypothetical protein
MPMHLFIWTFAGSTWSSESTKATTSRQHLLLRRKGPREVRESGRWKHRAWSKGQGRNYLSTELLIETETRTQKDKSGNRSTTEGGCGPKNWWAIGFKGRVIERIRMLIDNLRSNPGKAMNHIWSNGLVFERWILNNWRREKQVILGS